MSAYCMIAENVCIRGMSSEMEGRLKCSYPKICIPITLMSHPKKSRTFFHKKSLCVGSSKKIRLKICSRHHFGANMEIASRLRICPNPV
jgi:hypothetical protein